MFSGLPDPDPNPLIRAMDPDPGPLLSKNSKKNLDSFWTFFSLKNDVNVPSKSKKQ
jgi:hypothetical protein